MDDLYPNAGAYYDISAEPAEQKNDNQKQANKIRASEAMLKDLIADYEVDIAHLSSRDAIHVDPTTEPEKFLKAWYVTQEVKKYAVQKKAYLESLLPDKR